MNTDNRLFVAWRGGDAGKGIWGPVGILSRLSSGGYRFVYTQGARTLPGFRSFPGMPNLGDVYESEQLFPMFANRLLNKSRPEYRASLTWSGFDPDNPPDPIALLGITEGLRQTDTVELFPCPEPDSNGCFIAKFFVHGLRHAGAEAVERVESLHTGESLEIVPDNNNAFDVHAVGVWTVRADPLRIGYVPRYLARDIRTLSATCGPDSAQLFVERVNHRAPLQQRLLCRMTACWPPGFRPCEGEEFQPIVSHPSVSPVAG